MKKYIQEIFSKEINKKEDNYWIEVRNKTAFFYISNNEIRIKCFHFVKKRIQGENI